MTSIQIAAQPNFQVAPADISSLGGVPTPVGVVMFGVAQGRIYRFGEANDAGDRDWVEGGLEFYGIKGISRWQTESALDPKTGEPKYGTLSYIRFHLVSPYKGVTYCLQLSDGANRDGKAICPPAHVRGLTQSLLKGKRILDAEGKNNSLSLMPGVIVAKQGSDDANVTFLNVYAGDPFDTNSLTQIYADIKAGEHIEKSFEAFDAAIDELCEHLGQETPEATAEGVTDAINVDAQAIDDENIPF